MRVCVCGFMASRVLLALALVGLIAAARADVPDPWSCPRPSLQGVWRFVKVRVFSIPPCALVNEIKKRLFLFVV